MNPLSNFVDITRGFECGYSDEAINNIPSEYKLIKSEAINSYTLQDSNYIYCNPNFKNISKYKTKQLFENVPKLVTKFVANKIEFAVDNVGYYNTNSIYNVHLKSNTEIELHYLLGILNSKLINFWFNTAFLNTDSLFPHIQKNQLDSIPIKFNKNIQNEIVESVEQIITKKNKGEDTSLFEQQIDYKVFRLYGLTFNEVEVIDDKFNLTEVEYNNIKIE